MTGNDKLQKENQTLRNEIKELKNKLQKVIDDLSKSQLGWQAERINKITYYLITSVFYNFIFGYNLQGFLKV